MNSCGVIQGCFPNGLPRFDALPAAVQAKAAGPPAWAAEAIGRAAARTTIVQRQAAPFAAPAAWRANAVRLPPHLASLPRGGGQPLHPVVRQLMERTFRTSFGDVRVHVGPHAAAMRTPAFTHGSNIHFAPGRYDPRTPQGLQMLAHELTHVVQQRAGRVHNPYGGGVAVVHDAVMEAEAARMARRASRYHPIIQRITYEQAVNGLRDNDLKTFHLWLADVREYGQTFNQDQKFVDKVLEAIDNVRDLRKLMSDEAEQRSGQAATVEDVLREATEMISRCALMGPYLRLIPNKVANLRVMKKKEFELNYLQNSLRFNKDIDLARVTSELPALKGYEFEGLAHLRSENAKIHYAVHELIHAMATPQLIKLWGQTGCEGTTELLTVEVMGDSDVAGYDSERRSVDDVMRKGNLSLAGLADFYFNQPEEFPAWVRQTLNNDTLFAAFMKPDGVYLIEKAKRQLEALAETPISFRTPLLRPQPEPSSGCCCGKWCFITTACVDAKGLPDDCHELATLRGFRDAYVAALPEGAEVIAEYYRIAPAVVAGIRSDHESPRILQRLYESLVARSVELIESGRLHEAYDNYRDHVRLLKSRYAIV